MAVYWGALLLTLAVTAAAAQGRCAPSDNAVDCAVLTSVYAAWGSNPASWAAGISAGASYCTWDPYISADYGLANSGTVLCDATGRVSSLDLYNRGLGGTIPAALGNMTNLVNLCAVFILLSTGNIPPCVIELVGRPQEPGHQQLRWNGSCLAQQPHEDVKAVRLAKPAPKAYCEVSFHPPALMLSSKLCALAEPCRRTS